MNKTWYTSKTLWISAGTLVTALITAMGFNIPIDMNVLILGIAGLMGITLRDAIPAETKTTKK